MKFLSRRYDYFLDNCSTRVRDLIDLAAGGAEGAPMLWLPYLFFGLLLFAQLVIVGGGSARSSVVEKVFRFEVALWAFVTGILGVILLGAWLFTQHTFWFDNENLLLLNPLSLFLAVLAPLSIWKPRFLRPAAIVAAIVVLASATALVLKGLPWFPQQNLALIALVLPAHLAVAFQFWRRAVKETPSSSRPLP